MAGDWIKMRGNLWDDPRVGRLCDLTDCGEAQIIGGLYWLWATADQHTEDGVMPGLSLRQIDRKTAINGLGEALCTIGWLADHPEGVRIVSFEEHNGASAKKRAATAKRVANHRNGNDDVTQAALQKSDASVTGALAREEKEKEKSKEPTTPNGVVVGSPAADLPGKPAKPDCPHQEIIALYHEVLPMCPQIRDWTPARATQLRARWNEDEKRQNLAYWRQFFEYVSSCDFLVGRSGKTPFFADLEWITKAANFTKIREAKYENRVAS